MSARLGLLATAAVAALACGAPRAEDTSPPATESSPADTAAALHLRNGPNDVDLLGDGTPGHAFVSWRGNHNAHGFSTVAFSIKAPEDAGGRAIWQAVPFFGGPTDGIAGAVDFRTFEGADCTLADIRVVRHRGTPAEVVIARREMGDSFADSTTVRFDHYKVARNSEGLVGWPGIYFEFTGSVEAKAKYCDVNEAFARELHLGGAGLGRGDGGR